MTTPAVREHQSPLESALLDVHATLAELLAAADEQHAAVVAHDRDRLENVTRQQERLSARLTRAEAKRLEVLDGQSLQHRIARLPRHDSVRVSALTRAIANSVVDLKERNGRTTSLLEQSIDLTRQTLGFLQRLVTAPNPVYGVRGVSTQRHSVLVDGRA